MAPAIGPDIVAELRRTLQKEKANLSLLSYPGESLDVSLRRFATARKNNLLPALEMLRAHLQWCEREVDLVSLRKMQDWEVLGVAPEVVSQVDAAFPHYSLGVDLEGRPVTYIQGANYAAAALFQLAPAERIMRYHVWRTERTLAEMYAKRGLANEGGQLCACISVQGMTMRHVDKHFLALVKLLSVVDQNHYPERLGKMHIVGVSRLFFVVWRMVRPWLDARTAAKIAFYSNDDADKGCLLSVVAADQLPAAYGGAGPTPWARAEWQGPEMSRTSSLAGQAEPTPPPSPGAHSGDGGSFGHSALPPRAPTPPPPGAPLALESRRESMDREVALSFKKPSHRRNVSDDLISHASFSSALSLDEAESEGFFDALDFYVEQRLGEQGVGREGWVGEGRESKRSLFSYGSLPPVEPLPPLPPLQLAAAASKHAQRHSHSVAPALPPIPEERIQEVSGRLNRVRLLLDITNVLSLVLAISLLVEGNTETRLDTATLRKFGAASMSIALFSIVTGLVVYWGVLSGAARRLCGAEPEEKAHREEEEDSAV